jgi:hypothetical protein
MNKIIEIYKKGYRVTSAGLVILKNGNVSNRINKEGYPIFSFRFNGKTTPISIHRLQAYQKYGNEMFKDGIVVRHLNGIKTDNSWDNIAIGTHSDNMMDIPEDIRVAKSVYAASFNKKYNSEDVYNYYMNHGKSYKKTMDKFNISSKGTLHWIIKKENTL